MAIESITKTLGTGSGIDTTALVASLVEAQFATKTAQLSQRADTLAAQISGVAKLKSGITGFDAALKSLVKGGTLATQPTSSSGAVTATALPGARLAGFSARLEVEALASAQAATTVAPIARSAGFPAGTLSIKVGAQATVDIAIDAGTTIEGVAAKINATRATTGLTATLVNDGTGARLTIKGASGAAQAFEIAGSDASPPADGTPSLAQLSVGAGATGTRIGTVAADASVLLDGARFTRPTNSIADLVAGVRLDLSAVSTAPVTLGTTTPTAGLSQAVTDFVATFNEMLAVIKEQTNAVSGVLRGDTVATGMARSLAQLTTAPLTAVTTGPRTLADLGVATARDGTLSVDGAKLTRMLAAYPDAVEAMFADGAASGGGGIAAALGAVAARVTDRSYGLDSATTRYTRQQRATADEQAAIVDKAATAKTRLTRQFSSMDAKVAAYKSTQTFLTNQVAAWNKSDS